MFSHAAFNSRARMLRNVGTPFSNATKSPILERSDALPIFLPFLPGLLFHEVSVDSVLPGPNHLRTTPQKEHYQHVFASP